MRNKTSDLNNHLFAQLERLEDEDLTTEEIEKETIRAKAIASVADKIIDNNRTILEAANLLQKSGVHLDEDKLNLLD